MSEKEYVKWLEGENKRLLEMVDRQFDLHVKVCEENRKYIVKVKELEEINKVKSLQIMELFETNRRDVQ